jgi:hypothetical protein
MRTYFIFLISVMADAFAGRADAEIALFYLFTLGVPGASAYPTASPALCADLFIS